MIDYISRKAESRALRKLPGMSEVNPSRDFFERFTPQRDRAPPLHSKILFLWPTIVLGRAIKSC